MANNSRLEDKIDNVLELLRLQSVQLGALEERVQAHLETHRERRVGLWWPTLQSMIGGILGFALAWFTTRR